MSDETLDRVLDKCEVAEANACFGEGRPTSDGCEVVEDLCYSHETLRRQLAAMTAERDRLRAMIEEISVTAYASFSDDAEEIRETGSVFSQGRISMADTITRILEDREATEAAKEKP